MKKLVRDKIPEFATYASYRQLEPDEREDALKNKVSNSQIVQVKVEGTRPLIFDDVVVRISPRFATYMHIDYDEANACGLTKGARGYILK